jgi:hypothetical protein
MATSSPTTPSLIKPFPGAGFTGHQSFPALLSQFALQAATGDVPHGQDLLARSLSFEVYTMVKPLVTRASYRQLTNDPYAALAAPAADATHYDRLYKKYRDDIDDSAKFDNAERLLREKLLLQLDAAVLADIDPSSRLCLTMTMHDIWDALITRYKSASSEDLARNRALLTTRLAEVTEQSFLTLTNTHRESHSYAATHEFPIQEDEKVSSLLASLLPHIGGFDCEIRIWKVVNKTPAERTFKSLVDHLLPRVKELETSSKTPGHTAPTMSDFAGLLATVLHVPDKERKLPPKGRRGQPGAPAAETFYCWSHGHNSTHNGADCEYPKDGHKPAATARNTMGGENRTAAQVRTEKDAARKAARSARA